MKADVTTLDAKANGSVDLNEAVFGIAPRADILQRMVTYQLAARQAGQPANMDAQGLETGRGRPPAPNRIAAAVP